MWKSAFGRRLKDAMNHNWSVLPEKGLNNGTNRFNTKPQNSHWQTKVNWVWKSAPYPHEQQISLLLFIKIL